jgi:hypothetical protein
MTPELIAGFIQYAVLPWLFLLFAVILLQILRGDISTVGLLRTRPNGPIDPERITILAVSAFVVGAYALQVLEAGALYDAESKTYSMPNPPESLLVLLGGGHGVYLSGKLMRLKS